MFFVEAARSLIYLLSSLQLLRKETQSFPENVGGSDCLPRNNERNREITVYLSCEGPDTCCKIVSNNIILCIASQRVCRCVPFTTRVCFACRCKSSQTAYIKRCLRSMEDCLRLYYHIVFSRCRFPVGNIV